MIFTISPHNDYRLPYHKKINDRFSFHSIEPVKDQIIGWKLPPLGGHFIELTYSTGGAKLNFSFYKDFDLYTDHASNVLISNDPRYTGVLLSKDTIGIDITVNDYRMRYMDWKSFFNQGLKSDKSEVLKNLKRRLLSNLAVCLSTSIRPAKIVYTGGLDSSLLAFLCHESKIPFQCIIPEKLKDYFVDLPFQHISYHKPGLCHDIWGLSENIKVSFYDINFADCVTGFFGDTAMLHNNDLYHQCVDLLCSSVEETYDKSVPANYPKFTRRSQCYLSIVNIMTTTKFRQWFENFRILDPYRDPDLTSIICQLNWDEMTSQFGSAWIQREMIQQIDPTYTKHILKNKNQYPIYE